LHRRQIKTTAARKKALDAVKNTRDQERLAGSGVSGAQLSHQ
jgi:hypothetical protein